MEEEASTNSNESKETNPEGLSCLHSTSTSLTRFLISIAPVMVSLPGSDVNSVEQPAILQVLSPLNASEEKIDKINKNPESRVNLLPQPSSEELQSHNDVNDNDNTSDKNLVSSSHKSQCHSHLVITTPTPTPTPSPTKDCKIDPHTGEIIFPETYINPYQDNILDIESHLIETYNELFPNEDSVGINELPPIEDELQVGCSKIETNDNVRTVIEIEPAEVITKKPIEKVIEANEPLQASQIVAPIAIANGEYCTNEEKIKKVAEKIIADIEEEITNHWDKISSQVRLDEASKQDQTRREASTDLHRSEDNLQLETQRIEKLSAEAEKELAVNENLISTENPEETYNTTQLNSINTNVEFLPATEVIESTVDEKLSEVVNQQLSEVNSILDSQIKLEKSPENIKTISSETEHLSVKKHPSLKVVSVPLSKTASEEEERKLFIESLPPLEANKVGQCNAEQLALDCKREYYQSLKKYLVQNNTDKPPLPLQTYRWEDLRRAKERGGYPWTHLYKRPLGPDEQPEIVLMLRKSQEIRFTSESPKSNKKVRIDDHVSIQETQRYIQELSEEEQEDEPSSEHLASRPVDDLENHSLHSESLSFVSDSVLATGKQPKKSGRFSKVRRLFRRRRYGARRHDDAQSLPDSFTNTSLQHSLEQVPQGSQNQLENPKQKQTSEVRSKKEEEPLQEHSKTTCRFPIMKKLKSLADRQKKRLNIKRIPLGKDEKILLNEEPKILKLKNSPKSQRSDIPHFIEKQDSDDVLEIVELDESPSRKRRDDDRFNNEEKSPGSIVKPEEIIEISDIQLTQIETKEQSAEDVKYKKDEELDAAVIPPKKAPRLRREHVYEEIDQLDEAVAAAQELKFILDATSVDAIKQSLATQDTSALKEVTATNNNIPLDRMGSSEEEPITLVDRATPERKSNTLFAPISSIDSASSDEDRSKLHLQPVTEEESEQERDNSSVQQTKLTVQQEFDSQKEYKPSLIKEASPAPSEKKVTFSHVEDEAEPHREDIELAAEQLEATKEATKWKTAISMSTRRSASVGAIPIEKKHFVTRNESSSGVTLDVRCACQYFQSDSLLPERINPVDSRPASKLDFHHDVPFSQLGQIEEGMPDRKVHLQEMISQPTLDRRLMAGERITQPEPDRMSMRSLGKQRSWDQTSACVDISFVEKYPELEETARTRGLVVRSISDDDPHFTPGMQRQRFTSVDKMSKDPETLSMHSIRSLRRISRSPSKQDLYVADINIASPRLPYGRREQRSVSGSRRSSNMDLSTFSPQINVINPTPLPQMSDKPPTFTRDFRSPSLQAMGEQQRSHSRDFTPLRSMSPPSGLGFGKAKPPMSVDYMRPEDYNKNMSYLPFEAEIMPQNRPIDMSKYKVTGDGTTTVEQLVPQSVQTTTFDHTAKELSPPRSTSPEGVDFRIAKPPMSVDYMRPDETKSPPISSQSPGKILPQHRPIDMTKYITLPDATTIVEPIKDVLAKTEKAFDPLQQKVTELEAIKFSNNLIDIRDNIQIERLSPPLVTKVSAESLKLEKETCIDINSQLPLVDIDKLLKEEEEIAKRTKPPPKYLDSFDRQENQERCRSASPSRHVNSEIQQNNSHRTSPLRQLEPFSTEHLQLPDENYHQLKRGHSPERQSSPSRIKKNAPDISNVEEPSKSSYTDRLKTFFSAKPKDEADEIMNTKEKSPVREKSTSPPRTFKFSSMFSKEKSEMEENSSASNPTTTISKEKSPMREKSPSPRRATSSKFMSMFSKEKPAALSVVSGTNAAITNKAQMEPMSIKVVETFSLKVDEMDQYMAKPAKPTAPPPSLSKTSSVAKSFSSHEEFVEPDRISMNIGQAFVPLIIGRSVEGSSQFLVDKRTSQSELSSQDRGLEIRSCSKEPTIHHHPELQGKPLFSAPIMMDSSGSITRSSSIDRRMQMSAIRSPSEQRPLMQYKDQTGNFYDGRTQSTDRHRIGGSQDNLTMARMTKTVSFNFDERKSRLSQFERDTLPKNQVNQELLEKNYFPREHEYEPIGTPSPEEKSSDNKEVSPNETQTTTNEVDTMKQAEEIQKELEDRYFSSAPTTTQKVPQMEIEVEPMDTEEAAVVSDQPAKDEKKGFMASAQDRTRRMQAGFKNQAGKLKTKLKPAPKKIPSGSPKAKERKKFKAPEFSKIKMPEMKRPDMSKFKRPEFTKFSKPDMSKFKLPEKMNIKLRRSKSLKEPDTTCAEEESGIDKTKTVPKEKEIPVAQKKLFEFNFGTYPRALRKKKSTEVESSFDTGTAAEATSIVPSSETQPSLESSSTPQGDRGPGPVRSRWADKFSDVSYNDSEGSRYRRYGSEQESFDRESSLERRMRDDLEDTISEERNLGIIGGVTDNKQFAEFDEENRAIHEISNLRSGEFRRRPIVHQDSDVRSEDSKEAIGWTEKEIQKNTLLRKAEREAEASYLKFQSDEIGLQETHSEASSGKKVVLEEIGDDEFFLRKRGISQDNIEINQYIRNAFREGYDKPINALEHVGKSDPYRDYDVPPPKPRRLHKTFAPDNVSQEFDGQRSDYGDDLSISHNGSDYFGAPRRPMRKERSRSKYSMESQDMDSIKYMDKEYLRDALDRDEPGAWNDLNMSEKENISHQHEQQQPLPPRRQKRLRDSSMEKDSYMNGFGGRSVSNSFLQPTEDIIVYRTEHEYHHVPLATPDKYSDTASTRKSVSNYDFEERHSRGAISFEQNEDVQDSEKYVIDMMENDGYAIVRKEAVPKPTPPARRKKFSRSPGERFATMPNTRTKRSTPPPERPPPPRGYTPVSDVLMVTGRKSALSLDTQPNYDDDYEEPGVTDRNLQSGEIINKMKYRPLPPPPRPPREKRQQSISKESDVLPEYGSYDSEDVFDAVDGHFEKREESPKHVEEVEACTQTDPLPDDFVCEEFEITDDMKVIEPRVRPNKTIEELLQEELETEKNIHHQVIDSEQLAKGLQRFRDANQRSLSEKSRASSQADKSKSLSRPQTPSAILVERQLSTPIQKDDTEVVEASLIVRPIDDLELEEEELRREGLLTDSSQHSVSDTKEDYHNLAVSEASYAPSSAELDEALGVLTSDPETQQTDEEVERTLQRYRDELDAIGRELMETQTTSQEPSPSVSREEIKISDREMELSDRQQEPLSDLEEIISDGEFRDESLLSEIQEEEAEELTISEVEIPVTEPPQAPPRRKSTTAIEQTPPPSALEELGERPIETTATEGYYKKPELLPIQSSKTEASSESQKEVASMQTIAKSELPTEYQFPARVGDLEVERLRVHALQAGQIMVSQLHGQQISSDELECKSGNLVVKHIELPPGLIENIVEQVRHKERLQHLTTETQTSLQNSSEHLSSSPVREIIPPPKPPRLRDQQQPPITISTLSSADEQTQTEQTVSENASTVTPLPPTVFPTAEYLQSLAPLAFYNLHRAAAEDINLDVRPPQRHRRRHRRSSSSEAEGTQLSDTEESTHHRRRTRSTRSLSSEDNQSVTKAGHYIRGTQPKEGVEVESTDIRNRQVPALVVLFIFITFVVLLYLMSGRSVHTHHWDFFNLPGQEGR